MNTEMLKKLEELEDTDIYCLWEKEFSDLTNYTYSVESIDEDRCSMPSVTHYTVTTGYCPILDKISWAENFDLPNYVTLNLSSTDFIKKYLNSFNWFDWENIDCKGLSNTLYNQFFKYLDPITVTDGEMESDPIRNFFIVKSIERLNDNELKLNINWEFEEVN
jgi:hypothetical protein